MIKRLEKYQVSKTLRKFTHFYYSIHLPDEITDADEIFKEFDKNKDGRISITEFREGLIEKYPENKIGNITFNNFKDMEDLIQWIDLDKNGFISYSELKSAILEDNITKNPEYLKEAFRFFDKDKDGIITFEDLKNVLNECESEYKSIGETKHYIHILEEADLNSDKQIDYVEFYRLLSLGAN